MSTGPIAKLNLEGTLDAVQPWSVGLTVQAQSAPTSADLLTWLSGLETKVSTWWNATNGPGKANKPSCTLTKLSAYGYGELGTAASGQAEFTLVTPLAGSGTAVVPAQCAIVHSMLTGYPGRHNRGRLYLPATAAPIQSNNRLTATVALALATAMANFIKALATTTINGTTTAAALVPSSGASPSHFISTVSVGDVVDTQRRRRDGYLETRSSASASS